MEEKLNVCHCCGHDLGQREFVHIEKIWGYFSNNKDGQKHKIRLCEECYDAWVRRFKYPPDIEEITELI